MLTEQEKKLSPAVNLVVHVVVVGLMLWGGLSLQNVVVEWYDGWSKESSQKDARREAVCRSSAVCWGERYFGNAEVDCAPAIERMAKYSARWTNEGLHMKLSQYRWLDSERAYVSYIGDKVEFQNGLGAYQAMTYTCNYDTVNKRVIDIKVVPGRL
ncbi:hypothetical protein [Pseudomonas sp. NPDC089396]|uniref:hypothetical protein n=1 Tax=Pseudomonas sp. NPDC089396 TaxID=3364461 RepID=UPI0038386108